MEEIEIRQAAQPGRGDSKLKSPLAMAISRIRATIKATKDSCRKKNAEPPQSILDMEMILKELGIALKERKKTEFIISRIKWAVTEKELPNVSRRGSYDYPTSM